MLSSQCAHVSRLMLFTNALIGISGVSILQCWKGGDEAFLLGGNAVLI